MTVTPSPSGAEFDRYATGYAAGMEQPLKRALGGSAAVFLDQKVRWMLHDLRTRPVRSAADFLRLMDYGCGTGDMLRLLERRGFPGRLEGCDVSGGMLREAARRWTGHVTPALHAIDETGSGLPASHYDVVICVCALHHIAETRRAAVFDRQAGLLKPGGRLFVFEHNPFNPLTRYLVRQTPIDRHAQLLTARQVASRMRQAGLHRIRRSYLLFFPPRLPHLDAIERLLSWMPVGGQYMVTGDRPQD